MAEEQGQLSQQQREELERLLEDVERGRLDSEIVQKYLEQGTALIGDESPMIIDHKRRTDLARVLGQDPGNLRLHTSLRAQQAAEAMGARAFAVGEKDIFLGGDMAGKLDTPEGFAVLAHEATHTMQEKNAVGFSRPGKATSALEQEARSVENRVLAEDDAGSVAAMQEGGGQDNKAAKGNAGLSTDQLLLALDERKRREIAEKVLKILDDRRRLEADRLGRPYF